MINNLMILLIQLMFKRFLGFKEKILKLWCRHTILILSQPVFALSPKCCMLSREATNINLVFGLTRSGLEPMIYCTRGEHANHYTTGVVTGSWKCNYHTIMTTTAV
jgi:hypothetical protein